MVKTKMLILISSSSPLNWEKSHRSKALRIILQWFIVYMYLLSKHPTVHCLTSEERSELARKFKYYHSSVRPGEEFNMVDTINGTFFRLVTELELVTTEPASSSSEVELELLLVVHFRDQRLMVRDNMPGALVLPSEFHPWTPLLELLPATSTRSLRTQRSIQLNPQTGQVLVIYRISGSLACTTNDWKRPFGLFLCSFTIDTEGDERIFLKTVRDFRPIDQQKSVSIQKDEWPSFQLTFAYRQPWLPPLINVYVPTVLLFTVAMLAQWTSKKLQLVVTSFATIALIIIHCSVRFRTGMFTRGDSGGGGDSGATGGDWTAVTLIDVWLVGLLILVVALLTLDLLASTRQIIHFHSSPLMVHRGGGETAAQFGGGAGGGGTRAGGGKRGGLSSSAQNLFHQKASPYSAYSSLTTPRYTGTPGTGQRPTRPGASFYQGQTPPSIRYATLGTFKSTKDGGNKEEGERRRKHTIPVVLTNTPSTVVVGSTTPGDGGGRGSVRLLRRRVPKPFSLLSTPTTTAASTPLLQATAPLSTTNRQRRVSGPRQAFLPLDEQFPFINDNDHDEEEIQKPDGKHQHRNLNVKDGKEYPFRRDQKEENNEEEGFSDQDPPLQERRAQTPAAVSLPAAMPLFQYGYDHAEVGVMEEDVRRLGKVRRYTKTVTHQDDGVGEGQTGEESEREELLGEEERPTPMGTISPPPIRFNSVTLFPSSAAEHDDFVLLQRQQQQQYHEQNGSREKVDEGTKKQKRWESSAGTAPFSSSGISSAHSPTTAAAPNADGAPPPTTTLVPIIRLPDKNQHRQIRHQKQQPQRPTIVTRTQKKKENGKETQTSLSESAGYGQLRRQLPPPPPPLNFPHPGSHSLSKFHPASPYLFDQHQIQGAPPVEPPLKPARAATHDQRRHLLPPPPPLPDEKFGQLPVEQLLLTSPETPIAGGWQREEHRRVVIPRHKCYALGAIALATLAFVGVYTVLVIWVALEAQNALAEGSAGSGGIQRILD